MSLSRSARMLVWGGISALLYWLLFHHAGDFSRLAHLTANACVVQEAGQTLYYAKATPELCAARGGEFVHGSWIYALVPIAVAFAISYAHGLFTGLFWDVAGLKPAVRK